MGRRVQAVRPPRPASRAWPTRSSKRAWPTAISPSPRAATARNPAPTEPGSSTPACANSRARKATAAPPPASPSPCASACRTTASATSQFTDAVYGEQAKAYADIEDFALLRSDGMPTYHLANCADDADLRITHIIRGQEHLSNAFKHKLIFDAAGAESPTFAHLPLLMAPDGMKLSKRVHGPVVSRHHLSRRRLSAAGLHQFPLPARLVAQERSREIVARRDSSSSSPWKASIAPTPWSTSPRKTPSTPRRSG